jgi:hypothetical protein
MKKCLACGARFATKASNAKTCSSECKKNRLRQIGYNCWQGMIQRCTYPPNKRYTRYGGRGIKICKSWRSSFAAFIADMGPRPSLGHSIERRKGNQDYKKSNCYWATDAQQMENRPGTTHWITFRGRRRLLTTWARELGLHTLTLRYRFYRGWSVRRALTTPTGPQGGG